MSQDKDQDSGNIVPHQAIINLRGEVSERLPSGQVSARCLHSASHLFTLFGNSFEECKARFEAFVEAINRIPPETVEEIMREQNEQKQEEGSRASD